jgi:hypothetical protein
MLARLTSSGWSTVWYQRASSTVRVDDALVAQYCRAGDTVQRVRYAYGDHNSTLLTGAPAVEQFLADRFAGTPAVNSCP